MGLGVEEENSNEIKVAEAIAHDKLGLMTRETLNVEQMKEDP